jgi:hypothetical protein
MLTNAFAGGVLVPVYLVVLVLQLNPQVPVVSVTAWRWLIALVAFYGPYAASVMYFLILIREALASRPLSPAWFSVRLMAWLGAAIASAAAVVTWANLRGFRAVLSAGAAERMQEGATATTILAGVLFSVALLRYSFGRRGSRAAAVLLVASMLLSVAVPLWLRGPVEPPVPTARRAKTLRLGEAPPPPPRVRLLLIDGGSLGFIRQRVAGGQLPNFGRLLDSGATMDLATVKPTHAVPVWAAAATGKYPPKNGVRSDAVYKVRPDDADPVDLLPDYCFARALVTLGFVTPDPLTSDSLDSRTLWDIVADYGVASGIVAWPLTNPAHAARGYVISDSFDDAASSPLRLADAKAGDPTSAADIAREVFDQWQGRTWSEILPTFSAQETAPAARWDHAYSEAAALLEQDFAPTLTAVRYEGLDVYGHRFLPAAEPERFGAIRREDPRRSALDRYYAYLDAEVGRAIGLQEEGDLLLVIAGFGMEPSPVTKRLIMQMLGFADPPGTHESAPDGFLLAYGTHVAHGAFDRGAIVDIAPTVLYYMGLDIGRDMDGFARTDLFLRTYTLDRPVKYIGTHETGEELKRAQ